MRNLSPSLCILPILLLAAISCKKEGDHLVLKDGVFSGGLKASVNSLVLTPGNDNDSVVSFTWSAADFGQRPVIGYTLQLDQLSDTTTWTNAKTFAAGSNSLFYSFLGKDMNNLLNQMGLAPGAVDTIAIRIRSDVSQYNGSASAITPLYSNTLLFSLTPYGLSLHLP